MSKNQQILIVLAEIRWAPTHEAAMAYFRALDKEMQTTIRRIGHAVAGDAAAENLKWQRGR